MDPELPGSPRQRALEALGQRGFSEGQEGPVALIPVLRTFPFGP